MDISVSLIWFFVGVIFLIAELMLPGFIVIFFAGGSFVASITAWIFDISLTVQTSIFLLSSLILLFSLRKYSLKIFRGKVIDDMDDDYGSSKIGKHAVVTKTITPELPGEIKFMGSFWRATASDTIKDGQAVIIESQISESGLTFKVKAV
ncbi:MAG: NfeD family protein [Desulfamplus sp.]|nr:NfeD family protein [Desulfamplus sp.]MBF0258691.1 NfeD family protein [Desulfamplus sp.]